MSAVICSPPSPEKHVHAGIPLLGLMKGGVAIADYQHVIWPAYDDALRLHACEPEESLKDPPCLESFMCMLKNWREQKDPLAYAQQLLLKACHAGFDLDRTLGNSFLELFVGCRSMFHAQQIFNRMPYCDEFSWSSLIQGFIESGELQQAFDMLPILKESYIQGRRPALMAILKACFELGYIECAQVIHIEIIKDDLETDVFFGSALVRIYTKCGLLAEAQGVFDDIGNRDLILWNTLIAGYVDHGLSEEVMRCLREMQWQALPPSPVTIVYGLRACVNAGCLEKGRELCREVFIEGFEGEPFVGSALLNMFAKCSSVVEAQDIFDELPYQNIVLWNTLITGYVDHGLFEEALVCYGRMKSQGLPGNAITFACILKACANIEALEKGQKIHVEAVKEDYHSNQIIGNALVDLYIKCGSMEEAMDIFFELPHRDVFSWTRLIVAFSECRCGEKALNCLVWMELDGVNPSSASYVWSLKACGGDINIGLELHLEILKKGCEGDDCVGNALVDMYGKCGWLTDAQAVFEKLPVQNVISCTALVSRYAECGLNEKALGMLSLMIQKGISPSAVTYLSSLKACTSLGSVSRGQEIHMEIIKRGFECTPFAGNTLVDMYAKCGFLAEAQEVFNKLIVQCNVSWNTLILGYAECGFNEKVLESFQEMHSAGMYPNPATFLCSLKACGNMGAIDNGRVVHSLVTKQGGYLDSNASLDAQGNDDSSCNLSSALIDMYCKCGSMADAQQIFNTVNICETGTFNSLMTGFACQGESACVFHLLDRMKEDNMQPNEVTFLNVLSVCSHDGLLRKGQEYFGCMREDFGLLPTVKHHTCVVDLFCRAGQLDEAIAVAIRIPAQIDFVVWSSVLSACYKWGNVELASQAFENG